MSETADTSNVIIQPPIAWALAIVAGFGVGWLYPLQFVPAFIPHDWVWRGHIRRQFCARHLGYRNDPHGWHTG